MNKKLIELVFGEAAKSNVEKRKVGCVIVDSTGTVVGLGHNSDDGLTHVHAEVAAVNDALATSLYRERLPYKVFVSHQPCPACAEYIIKSLGSDTVVEVVKAGMKFDGDKLRYDLVPPSAVKALADVFTYGARKYKPHNWQEVDEPNRYVAALYRHLEAYRMGETHDQESGLHHLAHAMTNCAILLHFDFKPTEWLETEPSDE
ncbi:MAG: dATP/dGTP diphosphohydrolase domain-containing protein [Plesiomonas sp.]